MIDDLKNIQLSFILKILSEYLVQSMFFTGHCFVFLTGGLVFPLWCVPPDREKKERERGRDRNTEKQGCSGTNRSTVAQFPSAMPVTQLKSSAWLTVGLVTMDKTCGQSQNTHGCSYFSKWMNCNYINTLDKCLIFIWVGEVVFFLSFFKLQGRFTAQC